MWGESYPSMPRDRTPKVDWPKENKSRTGLGATGGSFGQSSAGIQCTAKSKRSGVQCRGIAMVDSPNQRCRMHGGHAEHAIGIANVSFKDGRHSKYLPARLNELYTEALNNPDLIEMADHIALLEAHMQDVLAQSASGDPVPQWNEMVELFNEVETAALSGDQNQLVNTLERMHNLLEAGQKWDRTWATVTYTMEQLRKMTDTEVKRKKELNQMVPIERVVILMAAVGQAVKRHVTDPAQIDAVYRELAVLHGSNQVPGNMSVERVPNPVVDVSPGTRRMLTTRPAPIEVD